MTGAVSVAATTGAGSVPRPGDTRIERCTWKCGKVITVTYSRYPLASGVDGFFWDQGDHECGVVRRAKFGLDPAPNGVDLNRAKAPVPPVRVKLSRITP